MLIGLSVGILRREGTGLRKSRAMVRGTTMIPEGNSILISSTFVLIANSLSVIFRMHKKLKEKQAGIDLCDSRVSVPTDVGAFLLFGIGLTVCR